MSNMCESHNTRLSDMKQEFLTFKMNLPHQKESLKSSIDQKFNLVMNSVTISELIFKKCGSYSC